MSLGSIWKRRCKRNYSPDLNWNQVGPQMEPLLELLRIWEGHAVNALKRGRQAAITFIGEVGRGVPHDCKTSFAKKC